MSQTSSSVLARMRPEVAERGYSRFDGTMEFYGRVGALLRPDMVVADLGAGRGNFLEDACAPRRAAQQIKGRVKEIIGLDIDPVVATNPSLDRWAVIEPGGPLPLADASLDLIVSDWTFEHVDDPAGLAAEADRVLKSGGWICARTPSRYSLTALFARLVPNRLHSRLLRGAQPGRQARDVFPTRYRLNSKSALARFFPAPRWRSVSYYWKGDPAYYFEQAWVWRLTEALNRILPDFTAASFMIFLQKQA